MVSVRQGSRKERQKEFSGAMARSSTRLILSAALAASALIAGGSAFLFFTNLPERGAATASYAPQQRAITAEEIDRRIAEQQANAAKPDLGPTAALAARPAAAGPSADSAMASAAGTAAAPEPAPDEGDLLYRRGLYPEALAKWREMAEAGNREAAFKLGREYLDAKPVVTERNIPEAVKFLTQAAEANEPRAQFEMGSLTEYGTGVPRDLAKAAEWYMKAALRGHVQGQYNVATMLETGDGLGQDKIEALKFYMLAAKGGFRSIPVDAMGRLDSEAPDALDLLKAALPPEQVAEAERRAAAFQPVRD